MALKQCAKTESQNRLKKSYIRVSCISIGITHEALQNKYALNQHLQGGLYQYQRNDNRHIQSSPS